MNRTELYIMKFYKRLNINWQQLSINVIARKLKLEVIYWPYSSEVSFYNGVYKMFINESLSNQGRWQDFAHEMYHYCHDHVSYDMLHENYAEYGESKADYFAYHFCVPTFMLQDLREVTVYKIMSVFNVEYDFALRRLEMFQSKMLIGGICQNG